MRSAAQLWLLAIVLTVVPALVLGCDPRRRGPQEEDDDDVVEDDDDSTVVVDDDDSSQADDDDDSWIPPEYLATYDFTLVMLGNDLSGEFAAIHGQMDVSTSSNAILAEMTTFDGEQWDWSGGLVQNEQSFAVRGWMRPPGAGEEVEVEVNGNFLADVDGTPSASCLTGIGEDDSYKNPDLGVQFAWYGCQLAAPPPAIDRAGSHAVTVTVHGDNCGAWTGTSSWTENWQFQGRRLTVSRGDATGFGILSDDGNIFRFTMLEQESPGRSLKVVGDFTNPTGTTEARAEGFCHDNPYPDVAGGVLDLDY